MRREELERAALRLGDRHRTGAHPLDQARGAVLALVPGVHAREHLLAVVDRQHRAFGEDREFLVGDHGGDLDDDVRVRLQPGHLQIDPDQVVGARHLAFPETRARGARRCSVAQRPPRHA
jgi:hypothetical protein